jgi:hypothetical protein
VIWSDAFDWDRFSTAYSPYILHNRAYHKTESYQTMKFSNAFLIVLVAVTATASATVYTDDDDYKGDDNNGDDNNGDDNNGDDYSGDDYSGDDLNGDDFSGDDYSGVSDDLQLHADFRHPTIAYTSFSNIHYWKGRHEYERWKGQ